jgi:phosphatidylethanolamine/phosphatidyl-N-methylethanolamine N-methyltransferase
VNAPGAVISGLPLLTFPERLQNAIITAAFEKMRPGGVFVQFTYGFHPPIQRSLRQGHGLTWEVTGTEFWNLPPAQVFTFRKPTPGERKAA